MPRLRGFELHSRWVPLKIEAMCGRPCVNVKVERGSTLNVYA